MRRKRSQVSSSLQLLSLRTIKRYNYRNDARRMDTMEEKECKCTMDQNIFIPLSVSPVYIGMNH